MYCSNDAIWLYKFHTFIMGNINIYLLLLTNKAIYLIQKYIYIICYIYVYNKIADLEILS